MKKIYYYMIFSALFSIFICTGAYAREINVGVEEEYRSITEAIDAAEDGDEILIGEGVYDETIESFPIIVDKQLYIHNKAGEEVVISSRVLNAVMKISASKSRVEGLDILFIRSGFWILADDITVNECAFTMSDDEWRETSCGMWVGGAKHMTLSNCDFTGCGIAVAGPEVTPGKTGVPVLTAMFEVGEDTEYFTTHKIENNRVNGKPLIYIQDLKDTEFNESCGQLFAVNCENVTFSGIDVSRASIGMEMAYCSNIRIINSVADECGVFGVYICKSRDCLVDNLRANNGAHGIDIRDADRCAVTGCVTDYCGQGIFYSWGRNCITADCEMHNNGTGYFSASGGNNTVVNCDIEGNELGLYIQHEPFFVIDTVIKNNTSCGLRFTDCDGFIYNCQFCGNFVGAMALAESQGVLRANTFENSEDSAVFIKDTTELNIEGNTLSEGEQVVYFN